MIFSSLLLAAVAATPAAPSPALELRGTIEFSAALANFFAATRKLESGALREDIRVAHFGDSHSTIDSLSRSARTALQRRFGNGGRGFVMLGRPYDWYNQDGIESAPGKGFAREKHAEYTGPGGLVMHSQARGSLISTQVQATTSKVTLVFERSPTGAPLSFYVDDTITAVSTKDSTKTGAAYVEVEVPAGSHRVEVRAGQGDAWVYGVELESDKSGIVYDALGVDGARASDFVQYNEPWLAAYMARRPASLVVLAYGANEASDSNATKPLEEMEQSVKDAVAKAKRLAPNASCLLLGPPDIESKVGKTWTTNPRLAEVIKVERAVASAQGCAFFDTFAAMGGEGTAQAWRQRTPAASRPDHLHYTPVGYRALSDAYAVALMSAYDAWARQGGAK